MDSQPLADRLRPQTLHEFVGQRHLVGEGKPLRMVVEQGVAHSMILWGPPGVGKTTLARIIAQETGMAFFMLSAVSASKNDIRAIVDDLQRPVLTPMESMLAEQSDLSADYAKSAILFLDEIHRFNKAQQDFLLPYVESGTIILIGATTENPSFEVISALLSRCQVFVLEALSADEVKEIIAHGVAELGIPVDNEAMDFLTQYSGGDARQALNLLEATTRLYTGQDAAALTVAHLQNALQSKHLRYDKHAEEHYNTISAYIKSMRASDVDAALYYLARMVDAGEDPKFIARRMVIFASEDIGMAQPTALVVANEVFRAVETIGYPECQINLAHGTVYMALAKKDRSACDAFFRALEDVKNTGNLPIPLDIRNAPTPLMKEMGYGDNYEMYSTKSHLPDKLKNQRYYPKKDQKPSS